MKYPYHFEVLSLAHGCPNADVKGINPQAFKKPFQLHFPYLVHWRGDYFSVEINDVNWAFQRFPAQNKDGINISTFPCVFFHNCKIQCENATRHKQSEWFPVVCSLTAFKVKQDLAVKTQIRICSFGCYVFLLCLSAVCSSWFSSILSNASFC